MPGTTRYSATFDRTYEEDDDQPAEAPLCRRGRSQSVQVEPSRRLSCLVGIQGSHSRSPSIDNGQNRGAEVIPTRTAGKPSYKAHNNPFQFVKVGTCPLYKKAEEQLKKTKEVKKPAVVKEDEEEWQSNLDCWKNRRRKMSEDALRRQEELRQLELEHTNAMNKQQSKKTKKFSEIVEERANRGRALSLCLFSNPLEANDWVFEGSKSRTNRHHSHDLLQFSGESAESSNINSEDDNESDQRLGDSEHVNNGVTSPKLNGLLNEHDSVHNSASNSGISKASELSELDVSQDSMNNKDRSSNGAFVDSGLESLSSSHRACDIQDSCSDFSQDSGSSLDCDSPRVSRLITTGVELLEEYSSKDEEIINQKQKETAKHSPEVLKSPVHLPISPKGPPKTSATVNGVTKNPDKTSQNKSVESENEMYVDDFEELAKLESELSSKNNSNASIHSSKVPGAKPAKAKKNLPGLTNGSINVIYQSSPCTKKSPEIVNCVQNGTVNSHKENVQKKPDKGFSLIAEVPVDKVAEEMEKLILEQLEAEEQEKEMGKSKVIEIDDKSDIEVPSKQPPKEKPPPPPISNGDASKSGPLKRVNSTKRILKEISKRRSDFLGIDSTDENNSVCDKPVPPPPALEDILRAECEQDRLWLQQATSSASAQDSSVEDEIARKEQEIIDNLETEERLKDQVAKVQSADNQVPTKEPSTRDEKERISRLKEEKKRNEDERLLAEEQKARLGEVKQLYEREEQLRKQEDSKPKEAKPSASSKNVPLTNTSKTATDSVPSSVGDKTVVLDNGNGGGANNKGSSLQEDVPKPKATPPAVAPKPFKKKEALRKERERLRQEQEALQKEREEHRRKVQIEQEQLKKSPHTPHVPEVPPVGPLPHAKPALQPQLTSPSYISSKEGTSSSTSSSRSSVNSAGSTDAGVLQPQKCKIGRGPVPRAKAANNDTKIQQRVPVRKQADGPAESRYNQNHWLIQEAEMRRIAEQNERQQNQTYVEARPTVNGQVTFHKPAFAENYRGKPPQRPHALPVTQNVSGTHMNYAVPTQLHSPDQQWSYGQPVVHSSIQNRKCATTGTVEAKNIYPRTLDSNTQQPPKPSRVTPLDKQEQMLSVSGRKRCSHCGEELGRGAAMIIESLQLYYHIHCFQCCVCQTQLGNGSCGTDVRVRNSKLHCHNCYSNDEAGLKFSQV